MNRRRWLQFVSILAAWLRGGAYTGVALGQGPTSAPETAAFGAFLDTLIPADSTASATQLGVHLRLLGAARAAADYAQLVASGCTWLDAEASQLGKAGFAALTEAQRESIVARAAAAPPGSLPNVFFVRVRRDAMRDYYALPQTWTALGYDGPPQPRGFPDHARPPQRGR